jgi:phage gpG-like protein
VSGTSITVRVDDAGARAAFERARRAGLNMQPAWSVAGEHLKMVMRGHFDAGGRPGAWKKSQRGLEGGKTLWDSGRLATSIKPEAHRDDVVLGTNVAYAAVHQFGGTIRPKRSRWLTIPAEGVMGRARDFRDTFFMRAGGALLLMQKQGQDPRLLFTLVKQVTIPARPFLVVRDQDLAKVGRILTKFVTEAFRG